jgi:hypothetical protein
LNARTRGVAIALAVLLAAMVVAASSARRSRGVLDAVPPGSLVVATVDVVAVRASPLNALVRRLFTRIPLVAVQERNCGFPVFDRVDGVALSVAPGDRAELGAAITGTMSQAEFEQCILVPPGAPGAAAHGMHRSDSASNAGAASFVWYTGSDPRARVGVSRQGPLIVGLGDWTDEMAAAAERSDPAVALGEHRRLRDLLAAQIGGRPPIAQITLVPSSAMQKQLAAQLPPGLAGLEMTDISGIGAAIAIADEHVRVVVDVECSHEATCQLLRTFALRAHLEASQKLTLRLGGFGAALDSFQATVVARAAHTFALELHMRDRTATVVELTERFLPATASTPTAR